LHNNSSYELDHIPKEVDDFNFAILDNSDISDPDFNYIPLIFLESFISPALILKIGNRTVKMPVDWQVVIGEEDTGDLEALPLSALNDRNFNVFEFNSLSSFSPEFLPIEVIDVYDSIEWYCPKLKNGQYLAVPIDDTPKPRCVYFVKDVTRACEVIEYSNLW